ncbi:response regulator [Paenibacillus sp. MCAF20]
MKGAMNGYKVYLADDERHIRDGVADTVAWEELGLTLTGTAPDGLQAYEEIRSLKPDIVITDIRMPKLNGLELIERTQTALPDTKFIVLSGYGEFELAAQAMKYGVKHYVLKPSNEQEIMDALREVIAELRVYHAREKEIEGMLRKLEQSGQGTDDTRQQETPPGKLDKKSKLIDHMKRLTAEHLQDGRLSLQWLAQHYLFMNSEYLGKQFRLETGEKYTQYLTNLRIDLAKQLLRMSTQLKMYEIAERCGFEQDPQYFANVFKKTTGYTAAEYRKKFSIQMK